MILLHLLTDGFKRNEKESNNAHSPCDIRLVGCWCLMALQQKQAILCQP